MKLDVKTDILDLDKISHEEDERISGKKYPVQKKAAPKTKTLGDLWHEQGQAPHRAKPSLSRNLGPALKMKDAFRT